MSDKIVRTWESVKESLAQIWQPIADSIGIPSIDTWDYNYIVDKSLYEQSRHFDENLWNGLTTRIEDAVAPIAVISRDKDNQDNWVDDWFEITLPGVDENLFQIKFLVRDGGDYKQVNPEEANGMFRTEMIEYLTKRVEVPAFKYVIVEICAGSFYEEKLIGRDFSTKELNAMVDAIVEGLIRTPKVYALLHSVVEEIGNKHIEKRNKIRQEEQKREKEEVRIVDEFATRIKPILEAAGWIRQSHNLPVGEVRTDGKTFFDVYVEGGIVRVLELQLSKTDVVRYSSPSQGDIISRIPALVRFVNDYKAFNDAPGDLCVMKDWNIIIT